MKHTAFKSETAKARAITSRFARWYDQGLWEDVLDRPYKREVNYLDRNYNKRIHDTDAD